MYSPKDSSHVTVWQFHQVIVFPYTPTKIKDFNFTNILHFWTIFITTVSNRKKKTRNFLWTRQGRNFPAAVLGQLSKKVMWNLLVTGRNYCQLPSPPVRCSPPSCCFKSKRDIIPLGESGPHGHINFSNYNNLLCRVIFYNTYILQCVCCKRTTCGYIHNNLEIISLGGIYLKWRKAENLEAQLAAVDAGPESGVAGGCCEATKDFFCSFQANCAQNPERMKCHHRVIIRDEKCQHREVMWPGVHQNTVAK